MHARYFRTRVGFWKRGVIMEQAVGSPRPEREVGSAGSFTHSILANNNNLSVFRTEGEAKDGPCKAQHVEMLTIGATDLAGRSATRCLQLNRTKIESTYQPTQPSGKSEGMACTVV